MPSLYVSQNPATEEVLAHFALTSHPELEKKLDKAWSSFIRHQNFCTATRAQWLKNLALALRSQKENLATCITMEMGKPIQESLAEIHKCAITCEFYAQSGPDILKERLVSLTNKQALIRREPLGPLLAVMPWNFPFWQVFRMVAPAILLGNPVLLKHAQNVPQCAKTIETLIREVIPEWNALFNLFVDHGQIAKVIEDRRLSSVTLTGSGEAGRAIARAAGENLKPVVLELGGSDPFIVCEDADLSKAVTAGVMSRLLNNGQSCVCAKRFFIHRSLYADFLREVQKLIDEKTIGDPLEPSTDLGPLSSLAQKQLLTQQLARAKKHGAMLFECRSSVPQKGFFHSPIIATEVHRKNPIWQEELFGPVFLIHPFDTDEEALTLANDTPFGLGANVFTHSQSRMTFFGQGLFAGTVAINSFVASDPHLPFGGIKESGFGRELGEEGLFSFANTKVIFR